MTRARGWRAPVATAAAIVVAAGGAALIGHGISNRSNGGAAGPTPNAAPRTTDKSGHVYEAVSPAPWTGAAADATNPGVLYVFADIDRTGGCGKKILKPRATETATRITLTVDAFAPADSGSGCSGIGHAPQRVEVT